MRLFCPRLSIKLVVQTQWLSDNISQGEQWARLKFLKASLLAKWSRDYLLSISYHNALTQDRVGSIVVDLLKKKRIKCMDVKRWPPLLLFRDLDANL